MEVSELISWANVVTAITASFPVGTICDAGNMNPFLPVSLSSNVYAYLIFAIPLAQSSDAPKIFIKIHNPNYYFQRDIRVRGNRYDNWVSMLLGNEINGPINRPN